MTGTIVKVLIVILLFVGVLGATYPVQHQIVQEARLKNYDINLAREVAITEADYLAALKHPEQVDKYLAASTAHAQVMTSSLNFAGAAKIYQDQLAATWGLKQGEHNEKWADASRRLAGAYRDLDQQGAALVCYKSVLEHDQKYLPPQDPRIARDLNNMGLMHYLIGMGKAVAADRTIEFKKAKDYLLQALAINEKNNQGNSGKAAATLSNLFLVCRDLGEEDLAKTYQKRAKDIDKSFKRLSREP
jgi:tetratricopeptide (TPR) repeat protein